MCFVDKKKIVSDLARSEDMNDKDDDGVGGLLPPNPRRSLSRPRHLQAQARPPNLAFRVAHAQDAVRLSTPQ